MESLLMPPRKGRRTQAERAETVEKLLHAAIIRIGQEGLDRLKLADVSRDAGKQASLASFHFGYKAVLVELAVAELLDAPHHGAFLHPKALGASALSAALADYFTALAEDAVWTRALLVLEGRLFTDARALKVYIAHRAAVLQVIGEHLKAAASAGALVGPTVMDVQAEQICGLLIASLTAQLQEAEGERLETRRSQLIQSVDRMMRGVVA
jgi:AcrR family transcriptional regulator